MNEFFAATWVAGGGSALDQHVVGTPLATQGTVGPGAPPTCASCPGSQRPQWTDRCRPP
ncbi:hypothetical protein FRAHR75_320053 [Frankia sp. Hr75.2]|nr:hypothetical protein FRAHR75_320053 [Frankia sp. Hr75.2]